MHGAPCLQCGSPMREGSISTARHNKSLQIYELITTTWLLFFSVPLKCSSETGEMVLTRVPACASLRKYIRDKKGAKEALSHCATLSTWLHETLPTWSTCTITACFFFLLSSSQNVSELENKRHAQGKSSERQTTALKRWGLCLVRYFSHSPPLTLSISHPSWPWVAEPFTYLQHPATCRGNHGCFRHMPRCSAKPLWLVPPWANFIMRWLGALWAAH